jgi:hypothetical protein
LYQIHLEEWALCNSSNLWKTLTCKKIFFNNMDGDAVKGFIKTVMGLGDWGVAVASKERKKPYLHDAHGIAEVGSLANWKHDPL